MNKELGNLKVIVTSLKIMNLLFTEKQTLTDAKWIKYLCLLMLAVNCGILIESIRTAFSITDLIPLIVFTIVILLLVFVHLETRISKEKIIITITPFLYKKEIDWHMIENAEVITYSPLLDYGGWGYRVGTKGTAINAAGNKGLKLKLKTGKNLLIGTQKADELKQLLVRLKNE